MFAGLIAVCCFLAAKLLGAEFDFAGFGAPSAAISFMLFLGAYARMRAMEKLADASQAIALTFVLGLLGGLLAVLAAGSGSPLVDDQLRKLDASIGLSASTMITALSHWPRWTIYAMQMIYQSSFPLVFVSLASLPFMNRSKEAWHLCFLFGLCLATSAMISWFTPAYGSYSMIASDRSAALPPQAGRYFWTALTEFRSGEHLVLSLNSLSGVITFPSFHAVMAILIAQAWWGHRLLRWPVAIWNGLIVLTAIPMGGHYFSDLFAGAIVWLALNTIAQGVSRSSVGLNFAGFVHQSKVMT